MYEYYVHSYVLFNDLQTLYSIFLQNASIKYYRVGIKGGRRKYENAEQNLFGSEAR